ncbi:MAG: MMPL family transporter [Nitrospiraceae bacterium]|nr:MMPL family transporter [Nitrospiraceae bacterium]
MRINQLAIDKRVTVVVFLALVLVAGIYSYTVLPRESSPEVVVPYVRVSIAYEGVAPEDMESLVTIPIERKLTGISGVKKIESHSIEGYSNIIIQFEADTDIDSALQKVRDKVDLAKSDIPEEADAPIVNEINLSELPIIIMCLTGDIGMVALNHLAEDIEDQIESIRGVLDVGIVGGVEREIEIEVDPERVARYGISLADLAAITRLENVNTPGGALDLGGAKYLMRVPGEFKTPDDLTGLVVKAGPDGVVYLRDIATVKDTLKEPASYSRVNGVEAVTITVSKRSGENIIQITDEVMAVLDKMKTRFPPGVDIAITLDMSDFIRDMVSELENGVLTGLILVLAVIFIFMGLANASFIALAIPVSMLMTIIALHLWGVTLNMVVLFSLILALGNLVDVSIVVIENTFRHMQEGMSRTEAAYTGVSEVAWAITGSTLTTVAGFFPLLFWPGIFGDFMFYLPQTVILALLASLFVGLIVNPALASMWMPKPKDRKRAADGTIEKPALIRAYGRVLRTALHWRFVTSVLFLTILVSITTAFILTSGVEFMPDTEPRQAYVDVDCAQGTALDTSDGFVRRVEEAIAPERENMEFVVSNIGSRGAGAFVTSSKATSHQNRVTMKFPKLDNCTVLPSVVVSRIRQRLSGLAGVDLRFGKQDMGPPVGPPINIEISGDDFTRLASLAQAIKHEILNIPGLVDVTDDYDKGKPEVRVLVDRQRAALAGLNTKFIGTTVKAAINGMKAGDYREGDNEYDVMVRFPKWFREDLANVESMNLINLRGSPIPFSAVARLEHGGGLGSITRMDRKRTVTVSGEVEGREAPAVLKDVRARLENYDLPLGYTIDYTGENEDQEDTQAFLLKAFVVALLLVTLVMVAEFNSILQPLIIMTTVVLSLSGVFLSLIIFDMPFGILMTGLGCISLAGVVVNNGIVLMDFINQLRARGLETEDAIVTAAMTRFRPVMLTAITTMLGLLPMAIGVSFDFRRLFTRIFTGESGRLWIVGSETSQWWGPMAIAVIVGLLFATLLTLIVVPTLYSFYDSFLKLVRWHGRDEEDSLDASAVQ